MGEKTANPGHFAIPTAPAAGTSCTSGAANVFTTTYVQLSASAPSTLFITGIFVEAAAALGGTYDVVQLATGAAASEVIVGQYLVSLSTGSTTATGYRAIYPFIPVATGIRIACKTADSVGSKATLITLECIAQANVVDDGVVVGTVTTVTNQLTAAAIATGVWQDAVAGDFTVASSVGKSLYIANVAPGAAGGHFIAGTNAATSITTALTANITGNVTGNVSGSVGSVTGAVGSVTGAVGSVTGAVGSVTGLTASNLDATVSSRMATYTQPTGFLAATFPAGTVANTTNITAGTITTATNLTNAPTAGDFTATMKTSLNAATPASVVGAVGSVTGAVGSVTAAIVLPSIPANWITAAGINAAAMNGKGDWNVGKTGYSLTQTFPTNFSAQVISAAGVADVNLLSITGTPITGAGTAGSPWGP